MFQKENEKKMQTKIKNTTQNTSTLTAHPCKEHKNIFLHERMNECVIVCMACMVCYTVRTPHGVFPPPQFARVFVNTLR